jgi:hypothetical protein
MDKADPFVKIKHGPNLQNESMTQIIDNAGMLPYADVC